MREVGLEWLPYDASDQVVSRELVGFVVRCQKLGISVQTSGNSFVCKELLANGGFLVRGFLHYTIAGTTCLVDQIVLDPEILYSEVRHPVSYRILNGLIHALRIRVYAASTRTSQVTVFIKSSQPQFEVANWVLLDEGGAEKGGNKASRYIVDDPIGLCSMTSILADRAHRESIIHPMERNFRDFLERLSPPPEKKPGEEMT